MSDWYRNTNWDENIAKDFEERLARARQKADYLRIQGIALGDSHPAIAIQLLERCVELKDPNWTAPALASIGGILLKQGKIDETINALDRATLQEELQPDGVWTNAPRDFCFLVALHEKRELYDRAWEILQLLAPVDFGAAGYARNGALSVIQAHRGETKEAANYAEKALRSALDQDANLPDGLELNPDAVVRQIDNPFTERLLEIRDAIVQT